MPYYTRDPKRDHDFDNHPHGLYTLSLLGSPARRFTVFFFLLGLSITISSASLSNVLSSSHLSDMRVAGYSCSYLSGNIWVVVKIMVPFRVP